MARLLDEGRVVRRRPVVPGQPRPKALWVIHSEGCQFAPGCVPLARLVDEFGERGVLARIRAGLVARCATCNPLLLDRTEQ